MRHKRLVKQNYDVSHIKPKRYATRTVRGADVIDMTKELNLNFNKGNILKYLIRDKNQELEDLHKIIVYAKREIEHLENN